MCGNSLVCLPLAAGQTYDRCHAENSASLGSLGIPAPRAEALASVVILEAVVVLPQELRVRFDGLQEDRLLLQVAGRSLPATVELLNAEADGLRELLHPAPSGQVALLQPLHSCLHDFYIGQGLFPCRPPESLRAPRPGEALSKESLRVLLRAALYFLHKHSGALLPGCRVRRFRGTFRRCFPTGVELNSWALPKLWPLRRSRQRTAHKVDGRTATRHGDGEEERQGSHPRGYAPGPGRRCPIRAAVERHGSRGCADTLPT
mmetsp:Transcript_58812/g.127232  ORF Transcript_58812/g.127232 Transcript_58812/m.127232 type:complete len:261 (+) Transcript_58812:73-855(+)